MTEEPSGAVNGDTQALPNKAKHRIVGLLHESIANSSVKTNVLLYGEHSASEIRQRIEEDFSARLFDKVPYKRLEPTEEGEVYVSINIALVSVDHLYAMLCKAYEAGSREGRPIEVNEKPDESNLFSDIKHRRISALEALTKARAIFKFKSKKLRPGFRARFSKDYTEHYSDEERKAANEAEHHPAANANA